jgi:FkbM family methyltransferase
VRRSVQYLLLWLYGLFRRPLQAKAGRRLFLIAYAVYKRFEARELMALAPMVTPGSTVVDVGANVGYCSRLFARWVGSHGRVIAIEPEARNAGDLRRGAHRAGLTQVECVQAAAGARRGYGQLVINPLHPADHRLGTNGIAVAVVTIDDLMAERGWPAVSLIKIDVQGAELAVINGAVETLRRSHPALYVEVDDDALAGQGAGAGTLVAVLETLGYAPHELDDGGNPRLICPAAVIERSLAGRYVDVLWLPSGNASQDAHLGRATESAALAPEARPAEPDCDGPKGSKSTRPH